MKLYQHQHLIWVLWSGFFLKATCETQHYTTQEGSRFTSGKPPEISSETDAPRSSPFISKLNDIALSPHSYSTELPSPSSKSNELESINPKENESGFNGAIEKSSTAGSETTQEYKSSQGITTESSSRALRTQQTDPPDDQQSTINDSQSTEKASLGGLPYRNNETLPTKPNGNGSLIGTQGTTTPFLKKNPQSRSLITDSLKNEYDKKTNSNSVIDDTTSRILATMALVNKEDKSNGLHLEQEIQHPFWDSKDKEKPVVIKFTPDDAVASFFSIPHFPQVVNMAKTATPSTDSPSTSSSPSEPSSQTFPALSTFGNQLSSLPNVDSKPPFANTILYSEDYNKRETSTPYYSDKSSTTSETSNASVSTTNTSLGALETLPSGTTEDASVNTVDIKSKSEEVSKSPLVNVAKSSSTVRFYSPSEVPTTEHTSRSEESSSLKPKLTSFLSDPTSEATLSSDLTPGTSSSSREPSSLATKWTTEIPNSSPFESSTKSSEQSVSLGHSFEGTETSPLNNVTEPLSSYSPRSSGSSATYESSSILDSTTRRMDHSDEPSPSIDYTTIASTYSVTSFSHRPSATTSEKTSDLSSSVSEEAVNPDETTPLSSSVSTSSLAPSTFSETSSSSSTTEVSEPSGTSLLMSSTTSEEDVPMSEVPKYSVSQQVTVTSMTSSVSRMTGDPSLSTTPMPSTSSDTSSSPETTDSMEPSGFSEPIEKSTSETTTSLDLESKSQTSSITEVTTDGAKMSSDPTVLTSSSPTTDSTSPPALSSTSEGRFSYSATDSTTTVASVTKTTEGGDHEEEHVDGFNMTSLDSTSSDDLEPFIDEIPEKEHPDSGLFNDTDLGVDYSTTQGKTNYIMVTSSSTPSGFITKELPTQGSYENIGPENTGDPDLYDSVIIPPRVIRLKINASQNDVCQGKEQLRDSIVRMFKLKQRTLDKNHIAFLNLDKTSCSPRGRNLNAIVDLQFQDGRGRYDRDLTDTFIALLDKGYLQYKYTVTEVSDKLLDADSLDPTGGMESGASGSVIAAIVISSIAGACLVFLTILLVILRKRQKGFNYGQRCTPVSLDDYSLDNISVYNSVRRKAHRASKRSYGNPAFEDPGALSHPVNFASLANFVGDRAKIDEEFSQIATVAVKPDELPEGAEVKNRYANVIPLPETRVHLKGKPGDTPVDQYINANYVKGVKGADKFYIACQGPLANTVSDFWQMVWEQQSRMVIMLTDLVENGVEKCANYLPASEVLDCHRVYGDLQVTLKKREVREKYIISHLQLKNLESNLWREVIHMWYMAWPLQGVPEEPSSVIAFLVEARSYIKAKESLAPIVVHCSPGTGRTGAIIAIDISIREFETNRSIDIPKTVYAIRRNRAGAVQTKDQYAFIYQVLHLYATKLTGGALDSI